MYDTWERIKIKEIRMSLQEWIDFNHFCRSITSLHKPLTLTWNRKGFEFLDSVENPRCDLLKPRYF